MGRRGADRPGGEARGAAGAPFAEKQGWDGGEGSTGASKVQATPSSLKRGGVRFVILSAVQTSRTGGVLCHSPGGEARSRRLTREVPGQGQGFPRLPSRPGRGHLSPPRADGPTSGSGIPLRQPLEVSRGLPSPKPDGLGVTPTCGLHSHCQATRPAPESTQGRGSRALGFHRLRICF